MLPSLLHVTICYTAIYQNCIIVSVSRGINKNGTSILRLKLRLYASCGFKNTTFAAKNMPG